MSASFSVVVYGLGALALIALGLRGAFGCAHALHRLLALNVVSSGVFLLLVTAASRAPGAAPDPVPHAMVLTGLVVSVSTTALALVLLLRVASDARAAVRPRESPSGAP